MQATKQVNTNQGEQTGRTPAPWTWVGRCLAERLRAQQQTAGVVNLPAVDLSLTLKTYMLNCYSALFWSLMSTSVWWPLNDNRGHINTIILVYKAGPHDFIPFCNVGNVQLYRLVIIPSVLPPLDLRSIADFCRSDCCCFHSCRKWWASKERLSFILVLARKLCQIKCHKIMKSQS
jgi:hypothetical protein